MIPEKKDIIKTGKNLDRPNIPNESGDFVS